MTDKLEKPLAFCFFSFCADGPISAHPLVPRRLRTEEFPSRFVGTKLLLLFTREAGAIALFVRVDGGFFLVARGKSLETGGMHQTFLCELPNEFDVDGTPSACGPARSEANCVAGFVEALANAVDPAKAEGDFDGFGPSDARLSGSFFVKADELLAKLVVVSFEPDAKVGWRWKECWFWRHGVQPARPESGRRLLLSSFAPL